MKFMPADDAETFRFFLENNEYEVCRNNISVMSGIDTFIFQKSKEYN